MSLDIKVFNKESGSTVSEMNWLRNPFGLERWAEHNVGMDLVAEGLVKKGRGLWYVCNNWAYSKASRVNRKLFKEIVDLYWERVQKLKEGYYCFDLQSFRQFVAPKLHLLPTKKVKYCDVEFVDGEKYVHFDDGHTLLAIPMRHFAGPGFNLGVDGSLDNMKAWFRELVDLADALQDKGNGFYCSN